VLGAIEVILTIQREEDNCARNCAEKPYNPNWHLDQQTACGKSRDTY
jgi:hypothetical protein